MRALPSLAKSKTKEGPEGLALPSARITDPSFANEALTDPTFCFLCASPPTDLLRDSVVYVNKRDPLR